MAKNNSKFINSWVSLKGLTMLLLLAFLFYPPYFRGLFFPETQHGALVFAAILFWLSWKVTRDEGRIPLFGYKMDYLILAFVGVYVVATFDAANIRLALNEVTKVTLYFLVYWMVSRNVRGQKEIDLVVKTLYFSGVGVALAGLMTATGLVNILDGYQFGRIAATLQYANALGGYLISIFFLGFYLWLSAESKMKHLYAFGNYIALTIFFASQSRGALLVFAPLLLLLILGLRKADRIAALINVPLLFVISIVINLKLLSFVEQGSYGLTWVWFLMGAGLALGLQPLQRFLQRHDLIKTRVFAGLIVGLAVIIIGGIAIVTITELPLAKQLGNAFNFVKEIKLESRNSLERQYFYKDAFTMIKERPILGFGGGGWQAAYKAYQSYFYSSRQVHNHYLQTWVEVGTLGILVFVGIWGLFKYRIYLFWKEKRDDWNLIWLTSLAALGLGIHAIIDFDLSLSALTFLVFSVFGIHTALETKPKTMIKDSKSNKKDKNPKGSKEMYLSLALPTFISIVLILMAGSYLLGQDNARSGTQTSSPYVAQEYLEKAITFDPFSANYYLNLAEAYNVTGNFRAIELAEKAYNKDPYNSAIASTLAGYYLGQGNYEKSMEYLEKGKEVDRFNFASYEGLSRVRFLTGQRLLEQGQKVHAQKQLEEVIATPDEMKKTLNEIDETEKWLWETGSFPQLTVTPYMNLNIGSAYYFLGNFEKAIAHLEQASSEQNILGEVYLWQSLSQLKLGNVEKAEELKGKSIELIPPIKEDYEGLKQIPTL